MGGDWLAVVRGLLFSQLLTLFVTPVVYTYMDSLQRQLAHLLPFLSSRTPSRPTPSVS